VAGVKVSYPQHPFNETCNKFKVELSISIYSIIIESDTRGKKTNIQT